MELSGEYVATGLTVGVFGDAPVGPEAGFGVEPGSELVAGESVPPVAGPGVDVPPEFATGEDTGLEVVSVGLFTGLKVDPSGEAVLPDVGVDSEGATGLIE